MPGYGVKLGGEKVKYEDRIIIDDHRPPRFSPRDERARLKREDQRLKQDAAAAEERARYEEKLKVSADDRQRYQGWREIEAVKMEDQRAGKRLGVKDEEWFHQERLKNDERSRYERVAKYDGSQQLVALGVHDR